jgi:hypothetical protein
MSGNSSYFQERLGLVDAQHYTDPETGCVACVDELNQIAFYPLDPVTGNYSTYTPDRNSRNLVILKDRVFKLVRPQHVPDGQPKYKAPAGGGFFPFVPTSIYRGKGKIKTLYLTEGYIDALISTQLGVPCIGLTSITCYKNERKNGLHHYITSVIKKVNPDSIVIVSDGDLFDLKERSEFASQDLTERLENFFYYFTNIEKYIKESFPNILVKTCYVNSAFGKGLGDALQVCDNIKKVLVDIVVSRKNFFLEDVNDFYRNYRDIIQDQIFCWKDNLYQAADMELPSIKRHAVLHQFACIDGRYFRIKKDFFNNKIIVSVDKSFISDKLVQYGQNKNLVSQVPEYDGLIAYPDHFERMHGNFLNKYSPFLFKYIPEDQRKWTHIETSLRHIFPDERINPDIDFTFYDFILDYYKNCVMYPLQKLPVICLVSKTQDTGKSTIAEKLNRILFGNNSITVDSEAMESKHLDWIADRLIVNIEEASIKDEKLKDRLKMFVTEDNMAVNPKFLPMYQTPLFVKFWICTNNVEDFMNIKDTDKRFMILNCERLPKQKIPFLVDKMAAERDSFISYLIDREFKQLNVNGNRLYFEDWVLYTNAFKESVSYSLSTARKNILMYLEQVFHLLDEQAKEEAVSDDLVKYVDSILVDPPELSDFLKMPKTAMLSELRKMNLKPEKGQYISFYSYSKVQVTANENLHEYKIVLNTTRKTCRPYRLTRDLLNQLFQS